MCHRGAYDFPVQLGTSLSGARHLTPTAWPLGTHAVLDGRCTALERCTGCPWEEASRRCSDASLICAAACIVSPDAFVVRGCGGTSVTGPAAPTSAGAGHHICRLAAQPGIVFHSHSLDVILNPAHMLLPFTKRYFDKAL